MNRLTRTQAVLVCVGLAVGLAGAAFSFAHPDPVPAPQTVTTTSPACSTRDTQAALLIPMLTRYDRLQEQALTAALTGHRRRALDLAAHTGPVTTTRWVEAKEACDE